MCTINSRRVSVSFAFPGPEPPHHEVALEHMVIGVVIRLAPAPRPNVPVMKIRRAGPLQVPPSPGSVVGPHRAHPNQILVALPALHKVVHQVDALTGVEIGLSQAGLALKNTKNRTNRL